MPVLELQRLAVHDLDPVSLRLSSRCSVLSGRSGSGKTLLLRAIADLDPHRGRVLLDGNDQESMAASAWRRRVGYLPAESHWWEDRVAPHFQEDCGELLHALGFEGDVLDWEVTRLSSGERQRLALARLLVLTPSVLLLDEPTANLDAASGERVEGIIRDYLSAHQALALWVSHDRDQRQRVGDRRFCIEHKTLVEVEDEWI
jgi:ABC-type iron transport system FetAB ATPase subunit